MRVAVIGTGTMGAGMAQSLQREGHDVVVWNRTRDKAEAVGVPVADSVTDAVTGADAVVTMLFDRDATAAVREELLAALGDDAVWVQSGTVGPAAAKELAHDRMLDAPMVGTKKPAEEGKLVVVVSGPAELIEKARPVFDAVGSKTVEVSDTIGDASALKLACNAWIATVTAGAAQSLELARSLGVDPELFLKTIEGGPADSPYAQLKGKAMLAEDYTPSFAVDGLAKDIALMVHAAGDAAFDPALLQELLRTYRRASDAGHGSDDIAAVRFAFPT